MTKGTSGVPGSKYDFFLGRAVERSFDRGHRRSRVIGSRVPGSIFS